MAETSIAGVLGHPVGHSLSPEIFGFLAGKLGGNLLYRRIEALPEDLPKALWMGEALEMAGFNVTIPHKEEILSLLDGVSEEARMIGAVNVVRRGKEWIGFNTDAPAVIQLLRGNRVPVRGNVAMLFGAGGAAKAVAFALATLGAREIRVRNRTLSRARALCARFEKRFPRTRFRAEPWGAREGFEEAVLLVNATSLGMNGVGAIRLPARTSGRPAWAFDVVYRPENTEFLRWARAQGLNTIGGLQMLVWQALLTWEIWFGRVPDKARLSVVLERHLRGILKKKVRRAKR